MIFASVIYLMWIALEAAILLAVGALSLLGLLLPRRLALAVFYVGFAALLT